MMLKRRPTLQTPLGFVESRLKNANILSNQKTNRSIFLSLFLWITAIFANLNKLATFELLKLCVNLRFEKIIMRDISTFAPPSFFSTLYIFSKFAVNFF